MCWGPEERGVRTERQAKARREVNAFCSLSAPPPSPWARVGQPGTPTTVTPSGGPQAAQLSEEENSWLGWGQLLFHFEIFSLAPRKDLLDSS